MLRYSHLALVFGCFLALSLGLSFSAQPAHASPAASCSNPIAGSNEVVIFGAQSYGGACDHLGVGDYAHSSSFANVGNDNAESIRVGSNVQAKLCQDDNYGGTCTGWLTSDVSNLDNTALHNNQLSSLHVQSTAPGCGYNSNQIILYSNTNFGGNCKTLDIGDYPDPSAFSPVANDDAESIRVGSSVEALLCKDSNFGSTCTGWLTLDIADLNLTPVGDNQLSSLRVRSRVSSCAYNDNQVVLYSDNNFGGKCKTLDIGNYPDASAFFPVANDDAESIRVGGSVQATLCRENNYGGPCTGPLTYDLYDLSITPVGDNQLSSLRVQTRPIPCYSLTRTANPANGGFVDYSPKGNCPGDNTKFTSGTVVNLGAVSNKGFAFANWSGDVSGTLKATIVTMDGDKSVVANFAADNTVPTASFVSPLSGSYLNTNVTSVQVNASDDIAVTQVQFFAYYFDGTSTGWHPFATDLASPWTANWDATSIGDQSGVGFKVIAADEAQNTGSASISNITLDRTPPKSAVNPLPSQSTPGFQVSWTGSDNLAGVSAFDVQYQDGLAGAWVDWLKQTTQKSQPFSLGVDGHTYGFRSRAYDKAGNVEAYPVSADAWTTVVSQACYTLTTSPKPSGGGQINRSLQPNCPYDATKYVQGAQVILTAVPGANYYFSSWTGSVSSAVNPVTVTVNGTLTINAKFGVINYLRDPGFELDANNDGHPDNWGTNAKFTRSSVNPEQGSYAGRFRATDNTGANASQTVNGLGPGKTYNFTGWVNAQPVGGDSFTFRIIVRWRNSLNTVIRADTVTLINAPTGGWVQVTKSLVSPPGTTNAVVAMTVSSLNGAIYVDNFSFGK